MKAKVIERLIKECGVDGEKVFDHLNDKSEEYLSKLLKIAKKLNAV
jgi:histone H3/H4